MRRRRLSGWALLGGATGLGVGTIAVLTLMFSLEDGQELSSRALSGVFDLTILGAGFGLIVGVVCDVPTRIRRHLRWLRTRTSSWAHAESAKGRPITEIHDSRTSPLPPKR